LVRTDDQDRAARRSGSLWMSWAVKGVAAYPVSLVLSFAQWLTLDGQFVTM